ncbi:MAG: hypothetical protein K2F96_00175, partial [Muribaculaceae bacterium]|nr:hypothetical protein [Muribaculaceae bacterium]
MIKHIISTAMALLGVTSINAATPREVAEDSVRNSHKVIIMDGDRSAKPSADSIARLMQIFYEDQFRYATEPAAPYFMFMTKNTNFAMGIGGIVKIRGWYDWHGALPGVAFTPYQIPMHPDQTNMRAMGLNASGTAIYLRAGGHNSSLGTYTLYVEGEFSGYEGVG